MVARPGLFPRQFLRPARCRLAEGQWEEGAETALGVAYQATGEWFPLWGIQLPEIVTKVSIFTQGFDGPFANVDIAYVYGAGEGGQQTYVDAGKWTTTGVDQQGLLVQVGGRLTRWWGVFGRVSDAGKASSTKIRLRALMFRGGDGPVETTWGPDVVKIP